MPKSVEEIMQGYYGNQQSKPQPATRTQPKTSTASQPKDPNRKKSVEEVWGEAVKKGNQGNGIQYDWLYRLNPWYEPPEDVNSISTLDQNVMLASSNFLEGFAWGQDIVKGEDDLTKASKALGTVSELAGDLTRTAGEVVLSAGVVTVASKTYQAVSWGSKALKVAPAAINATMKYAPRLLSTVGNAAARGLVFSGIEQALAPKERKPGLEGTVINTLAFTGGAIGNQLTQNIMAKYIVNGGKKISPLFQEILSGVGDTVGGMVASFPFVENKDKYMEEFGGQVVVTGILDTIMYGLTKKHIQMNKEVKLYTGIMERAAKEFYNTGSESSAKSFYDAAEQVIKSGSLNEKNTTWVRQLFEQFNQARREKIREHGGQRNHLPLFSDSIDSDEIRIDKLSQELVMKNNTLKKEDLDYLANAHKPSNGDSINTPRFKVGGTVREVIKTFADRVEGRQIETHDDLMKKVKKALPDEEKLIKSVVEEFGVVGEEARRLEELTRNAPEVITKYRAIMASNAAEIRYIAKKIHNSPNGITDLELAQFMYRVKIQDDITHSVKGIWNNFGRTLSSGNIDVGGKLINLADIFPEDLINDMDLNNTIEAIIHTAGGKGNIRKLAQGVLEAPDLSKLNYAARKAVRSKPIIRAIVEGRTASLLTSPFTSAYNVVSQATNQALEHVTEFVSVGLGSTIDVVTGQKTHMTLGEFGERVKGDVEGMFIRSYVKPMIKNTDVNVDFNIVGKTPLEWAVKLLETPQKLEQLLNETSLNPRQEVEGLPTSALSTDALKGTAVGDAVTGVGQGLDKVRQVILKATGKDISLDPNSVTMVDLVNGLLDAGASMQRLLSFGLLELGDRPFASGAYHSELAGNLDAMSKTADLQGLTSKEWKQRMKDQVMAMRQFKTLKKTQADTEIPLILRGVESAKMNVINDLDEKAFKFSNYMTWKDPFTSDFAKNTERWLQHAPALRFVIPFYHTPSKILAKTLRYTPGLNMFAESVRNDISGKNGSRARDMALSRMLVGTALYFAGWQLAMSGFITPNAPPPGQAKQMRDANIPRGSLYIPGLDKWMEITRIDPAPSAFFGITAEMVNIFNNPEISQAEADDVATTVMLAFARQTLDKTWLKGVNDTLSAVFGRGSKNWLERSADTMLPFYGARQAAPQIHAFGLNPLYNEHFQEVTNFLDRFQPSRDMLDSYGKPASNQQRLMGLKVNSVNDSPVRKVAIAVNARFPDITKSMYGTTLKDSEQYKIKLMLDKEIHLEDKLNELVSTKAFQSYAPELQQLVLEKYYNAYVRRAKGMFLKQNPDVLERIKKDKLTYKEHLRDQEYVPSFAPWLFTDKGENK